MYGQREHIKVYIHAAKRDMDEKDKGIKPKHS
jgi:hypothetical protein